MSSQPKSSYGLSNNLFVSRKAGGESIVIGGIAENAARWTRVLTQRAAQMLWFNLTQLLFPDKSDMVTAMVMTAPLRSSDLPTITTHVTVDQAKNGNFEVTGWIGSQTWMLALDAIEARRFWTALDIALYPVGWQGQSSHPKPP